MSKRMARLTQESKNTKVERNRTMLIDKYYEMKKKLDQKKISNKQWQDFCQGCLEELMVKNQDVLKRLKER